MTTPEQGDAVSLLRDDTAHLIAVGIIGEPNAAGLTWDQAFAIGSRVSARLAALPAREADTPDLRAAAEQAFHWFVMSAGEYHAHYGHNDEPIEALRAALASPDPTSHAPEETP